ncbi:hypothetical protein AURDEDRAFT_162738 [Auricularia subglabra TFB-10046 SS5]|nr:hypothetical protein AURDEDRAFT_162738 [Auricularia subglabra TFB-10046 SS5]
MTSTSLTRSTLQARLADVVKQFGGASLANTAEIISRTARYTKQLHHRLSTDSGLVSYIQSFEEQSLSDGSASTAAGGTLRDAVDEYLYHEARQLRDLPVSQRSEPLAQIIETLCTLVRVHVRASEVKARLASQPSLPPHRTASLSLVAPPPAAPADATLMQDGDQCLRRSVAPGEDACFSGPESPQGSPVTPSDGQVECPVFLYEAPLPSPHEAPSSPDTDEVDGAWIDRYCAFLSRRGTFAEFFDWVTQKDRRCGIAGRQSVHLDFLSDGANSRPDHFPSVDMLRQVSPDVVSLKIDIPFQLGQLPALPFPYLELLVIDARDATMWAADGEMKATLIALRADHIRELHFVNASRTVVAWCEELVNEAHACLVVDDGDTRYVAFEDCRGFERYVSGQFINGVSSLFNPDLLSTVTTLTLGESLSNLEMELLFRCFPRHLERLVIWFGGAVSSHGTQRRILEWRNTGGGCCARLQRLTLTRTWPLKDRRAGHPGRTCLSPSTVIEFLHHIHGGQVSIGDIQVDLDGVDLLPFG